MSSSLSPMDQVKFLTPEQLGKAVGGAMAQQIEAATRQRQETQLAKTVAVQAINELKLLVSGLIDDPGVPPSTKTELTGLLEKLRDGVNGQAAAVASTDLGDLFE